MKKQLTLLLLTLFVIGAKATDRYVNDQALPGTYANITAALAASSAGDRVLVYPNGSPYAGFTYAGGGIQILSAVEGIHFQVNQTINIGVITGPVLISGMKLENASILNVSGANLSSPQIVRIARCMFEMGSNTTAIRLQNDNFIVHVQSDTIMGGAVYIGHGSITGCDISTSFNAVVVNSSNLPLGDTVQIIGNKMEYSGSSSIANILLINSTSIYFNIQNNFILMDSNSVALNEISITNTNTGSGANSIINNTLIYRGTLSSAVINYASANCAKVNVINNGIGGYNIPTYAIKFTATPPTGSVISYNHSDYNAASILNFTDDGTNDFGEHYMSWYLDSGEIINLASINAGHPGLNYLDLNLTRNNIGCFGGSYSRANFITNNTDARVLMMTAPRVVIAGQPFSISAEGLDE